jgi:hypothetical protein
MLLSSAKSLARRAVTRLAYRSGIHSRRWRLSARTAGRYQRSQLTTLKLANDGLGAAALASCA